MTNQPTVTLLELGLSARPAAIVEGFAAAPALWRDQALGSGYEARGDFYPGPRKHVDPGYFSDVGGRLGAVMRSVFGCSQSLKVDRALYSIVDTPPKDLSLAQRIPHFDDSSDHAFAMVHYLSHTPFGGTAFYRHKSTGLSQIPAQRHAEYLQALTRDLDIHGEPEPSYIAGSTAIFEQTGQVDFSYNRAVIYHGNQLHCPMILENLEHVSDPFRGRLTIAVFFRAM
ncbi:DUF6445 family protein [Erythrobacter sp.]|uniref:DUF6445 family protein n=1 Tax=Erythrobacter sp. TaxID=1042 RepID=UPI00311F101F